MIKTYSITRICPYRGDIFKECDRPCGGKTVPLDGGKIVILLIEGIRKKPLNENIETKIQLAGFFLLIGLSIYVTYNDILRIF